MPPGVKITVLRRDFHADLVKEFCEAEMAPCNRFEEGQTFISEGVHMPEGFCSWAWCDIQKYVMTLARGGDFGSIKPGAFITCCTDGFRPVTFKLERL